MINEAKSGSGTERVIRKTWEYIFKNRLDIVKKTIFILELPGAVTRLDLFSNKHFKELIGDVEYGIHGPATAPGQGQGKQAPAAIESAAFRIAASLVDLLTNLGVENEKVKLLFIRVPNSSMYSRIRTKLLKKPQ